MSEPINSVPGITPGNRPEPAPISSQAGLASIIRNR